MAVNAHTDDELYGWLNALIGGNPARNIAPAGDFLKTLAETAFRADMFNYEILRPALLSLKAKYPEYDPRYVVPNEILKVSDLGSGEMDELERLAEYAHDQGAFLHIEVVRRP